MQIKLSRVVFGFALACLTAQGASASIAQIAPFAGTYSETWESFPNYNSTPGNYLSDPTDIMGGFASVSNPGMIVYEPGMADFGISSNGVAKTSDGVKGLGINSPNATSTIVFDSPITRFGAYWGATEDSFFGYTDDITLNFSDGSTAVFNMDPVPAGSGNLVWRGWSSTLAITSLTFKGDYVVVDGLQAAIPEPATLGMFAAVPAGLLRRRRR